MVDQNGRKLMTHTAHTPVPNSKESEMMVLGCMLTSSYALDLSCGQLTIDDFYFAENKAIFQILKTFYKNDRAVDVHLVCEDLKRQDILKSIGGPGYVATLAQFAGTSANVEEYCDELRKKSLCRQALKLHQEAIGEFIKDPEDPQQVSELIFKKMIDL